MRNTHRLLQIIVDCTHVCNTQLHCLWIVLRMRNILKLSLSMFHELIHLAKKHKYIIIPPNATVNKGQPSSTHCLITKQSVSKLVLLKGLCVVQLFLNPTKGELVQKNEQSVHFQVSYTTLYIFHYMRTRKSKLNMWPIICYSKER